MRSRSRARPVAAAVVLLALLLPGAGPGPVGGSEPASAQEAPRPNFVVILTDDQRWDTIGRCVGGFDGNDLNAGTASCMPKLQQHLVANGMTFRRGYATTSLCCPSRASILTGRYSRHTGVIDNFGFPQFDDSSSLATWLDDAGYRTALIGKYLNGYGEACCAVPANYIPPGWDSWHAFWGVPGYTSYSMVHKEDGGSATTVSYSGSTAAPTACAPEVIYSTDHLCRRALNFLASDAGAPFFLFFTPFSPHQVEAPPSRWSRIYTPTNQPVTLPKYPNHNEVPSPNPPSWLPTSPLSSTKLGSIAAGFTRSLRTNRAVDDSIEALVQQLGSDGRLSNTVFFFLSDNGLGRAEHRHDTKACEYEECHRVPFVVLCPPSVCPGSVSGQIDDDHFALNIDLAPTVAQLAGVAPPEPVDGRSLVPLLTSAPVDWRTSFLIEEIGMVSRNKPVGIVSIEPDGHTYKYVKFLRTSAQREMYDLTVDPWELANLANDGVHTEIQNRLAAALDQALRDPTLMITQGPSGPVAASDVTFEWSSDEPVVFECALDSGDYEACGQGAAGSKTYRGLGLWEHSFRLKATDPDNNVSSLQRDFNVTADTTPPPAPGFVEAPSDPSGQDVAFSFTDDEEGAVFTCSLDGEEFSACLSPYVHEELPHGAHTFAVKAIDSAGNTSAAASFSWNVIDTRPPPAPVIDRSPSDPSGPDVSFAFSSDEPEVSLSCSLDGGTYTDCTSPHSFAALSDGAHDFRVRAVDAAGNASAPASHVWTVDNVPAAPRLTSTPRDPSSPHVSFSFATEPGLQAQCSLDDDPFAPCFSPWEYEALSQGTHTFRVRSSHETDGVSGADSYTWLVDSVAPPAPVLDATPEDPSRGAVTFAFSNSEQDVSFACSLNGGAFQECKSPWNYIDLATGFYTFRVRASDPAGNVSGVTVHEWNVDVAPPAAPILTEVPPDPSASGTASFSFVGDEPQLDYMCSLDGGSFEACSSPALYESLSAGAHTFELFAVDDAENASPPITYSWIVDLEAPRVSFIGWSDDTLISTTTYNFSWAGSDDVGIVGYGVYERSGTGGPRSKVATTQSTTYKKVGSRGATYCHEIEAYDAMGRTGTTGERCRGVAQDDTHSSISYSGAVTRMSATGAYGTSLTVLDGSGEDLHYAFEGRRFGLLARRTPDSGRGDLYIDGVFVRRIDFYSSSIQNRIFVYESPLPDGPHTIDLLWSGTAAPSSTGTAIYIDGLGTISRT